MATIIDGEMSDSPHSCVSVSDSQGKVSPSALMMMVSESSEANGGTATPYRNRLGQDLTNSLTDDIQGEAPSADLQGRLLRLEFPRGHPLETNHILILH